MGLDSHKRDDLQQGILMELKVLETLVKIAVKHLIWQKRMLLKKELIWFINRHANWQKNKSNRHTLVGRHDYSQYKEVSLREYCNTQETFFQV